MQHKHLNLVETEVKFGAEGSLKFSGYASVFGGVDSYGDTIVAGAYAKTLADRDRPIALRWNHFGPVIGKWTSIKEDDRGLKVEGELTKGHRTAEDAAALLRHGAISGLSIGYIAKDSDPTEYGGRKLKEIELIEISVVEEPADNAAHVDTVKSSLREAGSLADVEAALRQECGLSRGIATEIVVAVKRAVKQGEPEREENAELIKSILDYTPVNLKEEA